jgi:hypothetical protein
VSEKARETAATIIRAIGAGAAAAAGAFNPGIGITVGAAVELAAVLTTTLGTDSAAATLERLAKNPAPLITQADLDRQEAEVIAELGGSDG